MLLTSACTSSQANGGELSVPSQWKLVSFGKSGAETPVIEGSSITLEFEEKGQLGGSGGCNSYGGTYEMQGNTLAIKSITSTLMACADGQITQQEQQYFGALQSATGFEISGDNLTILYEDGQSKLNFVKATTG
jgi:heat shock protein HslJ